jgi:hypothetical protein
MFQDIKRTAKETLAMAKEMQSGNFAMSSLKVIPRHNKFSRLTLTLPGAGGTLF